jgi:hypothetical protein
MRRDRWHRDCGFGRVRSEALTWATDDARLRLVVPRETAAPTAADRDPQA